MDSQVFAIEPPSRAYNRIVCYFALGLGLFTVLTAFPAFFITDVHRFEFWFTIGAHALIALFITGVVFLIGWSIRYMALQARFELTDRHLRLHQYHNTKSYPRAALLADEARVIDLAVEGGYRPNLLAFNLKANATPSCGYFYNSGLCDLRNDTAAQLCTTDAPRVVYIPVRDQPPLILSPQDPDGLLRALQTPA